MTSSQKKSSRSSNCLVGILLTLTGLLQSDAYVVIVPGFLFGARKYEALRQSLNDAGLEAVVAPVHVWHWLPCLGGRSVRPILERIDWAVDWLSSLPHDPDERMPWPEYSLSDLLEDTVDNPGGIFAVGGSTEPEEFPVVTPRGSFWSDEANTCRPFAKRSETGRANQGVKRVALVGHSASGWISRLYLSSTPYGGHVYVGASKVRA